jgi:hypothetical protein
MAPTIAAIKKRYARIAPHLNERTERLWCAAEAESWGRGGITLVQRATHVSRPRITRGVTDLDASPLEGDRLRRKGGGRTSVVKNDLTLLTDLDALINPTVRGDPMCGLRWTCKSTRGLARELCKKGHQVGETTVRKELHVQNYSLQGNRKTQEGASHPDRNAQFLHIHETATAFQQRQDPVISIDTKKKELVGNYRNGGKEWAPEGKPHAVKTHDFIDKKLGKAIPYGVYDIAKNKGFVSVGIDHDTGEFAVQAIRRWWEGDMHPVPGTRPNSRLISFSY